MIVTAIKTPVITTRSTTLIELLDSIDFDLSEGSILAITSKVMSLCEGSVAPKTGTDKEALIIDQADQYLPPSFSQYGYHFTITQNTLISVAGIDESNGDDRYVLWPTDPWQSARDVQQYLAQRFSLAKVGVIITDSTSQPLRIGTHGISIGHAGFVAINNYVGQPDLFGQPFRNTRSNIVSGLAAAATLCMGEGSEQTPLCTLTDLDFVQFRADAPTKAELAEFFVSLEDDLYAPFWKTAPWQKGQRKSS